MGAADERDAIGRRINELAHHPLLQVFQIAHSKEQMALRCVIMTDVLYVLQRGAINAPAERATRDYSKYRLDGFSPNSDARRIGVVCIPDFDRRALKLVTVMWVDEIATRAGTVIGGDDD